MPEASSSERYFREAIHWSAELNALRALLHTLPLDECLKWNKPCYTFEGKNVVLLQPFKEYCAVLFFKGMLLEDPHQLLQLTGPNTRVGRQYRCHDVAQLTSDDAHLRALITAAIDLEKTGASLPKGPSQPLVYPDELKSVFAADGSFLAAFEALTPGRQKGYCLYIEQAKQSATKIKRIARIRPAVLEGRGLHDTPRTPE